MGYILVLTRTCKTMIPYSNIASIHLSENCNVIVDLNTKTMCSFLDDKNFYKFTYPDYDTAEEAFENLVEKFGSNKFGGTYWSNN